MPALLQSVDLANTNQKLDSMVCFEVYSIYTKSKKKFFFFMSDSIIFVGIDDI